MTRREIVLVLFSLFFILILALSSTRANEPLPISQMLQQMGDLVQKDDVIGAAVILELSESFRLDKVRQAFDAIKTINTQEKVLRGEMSNDSSRVGDFEEKVSEGQELSWCGEAPPRSRSRNRSSSSRRSNPKETPNRSSGMGSGQVP
jgi:hypothetical protein